jgi:carbon storage regulator
MMLVLSRFRGERIVLRVPGYPEIVVTLVEIFRDKARIGIEAPLEVTVHREEVAVAIDREMSGLSRKVRAR